MKIIIRIIILYLLIHYCSACPASRRFIKPTTSAPPWTTYPTPYPTPYPTTYQTPWPWTPISTFMPNFTTPIPSIPGRIKAIKIKTGSEGMKNGTLNIKICSGVWECCKIPKLGRGILRAFKANHEQTFIALEISKCDNFSLPTMKKITIQPHFDGLKTEGKRTFIPLWQLYKLHKKINKKSVVSKSWTG
jgi:hypothetical protein